MMLRIELEDPFRGGLEPEEIVVAEHELRNAAEVAMKAMAIALTRPDRHLTVEMAKEVIGHMKQILNEQEVAV